MSWSGLSPIKNSIKAGNQAPMFIGLAVLVIFLDFLACLLTQADYTLTSNLNCTQWVILDSSYDYSRVFRLS